MSFWHQRTSSYVLTFTFALPLIKKIMPVQGEKPALVAIPSLLSKVAFAFDVELSRWLFWKDLCTVTFECIRGVVVLLSVASKNMKNVFD